MDLTPRMREFAGEWAVAVWLPSVEHARCAGQCLGGLMGMAWFGPNDGGIKRGDREDTGDNEARPTDLPPTGGTGDGSSIGGDSRTIGEGVPGPGAFGDSDLEDLTVVDADDPSLGLTDFDDPIAAEGPTRTGEANRSGVDRDLADRDRSGDRKVDFDR